MKQLLRAAAAALALTAALAGGAQARTEARVLVTLAAQDTLAAPRAVAPGTHAVVLRNLGARERRVAIVRVPGGIASLVRFEGLFFLPAGSRVVHDLGHVRPRATSHVRVRIRPGAYLLASFEGSAVAAARPLTVGLAARTAAAVSPELARLPGSRVGRVAGTRAYVGLSFDGGRLRAYVCDGADGRPPSISQWLQGRWNGRSALTLARNRVELRIRRVDAGGRVSGVLRIAGRAHAFAARLATGAAGLYDGADAKVHARVSWIVLHDRSGRGAMVDPRPRKCRPVQVTLADGTTEIVTVCKMG
jgi:hypothetical protein